MTPQPDLPPAVEAAVEIIRSLPEPVQEQLDSELARFPLERVMELGRHVW